MGMSIYYEAKRETEITKEESKLCWDVIHEYCSNYPFEEKYEDFGVFDVDKDSDIIFMGATKLPMDDAELMYSVANYWLKCLTEITHILKGCHWSASFEGVDFIFDSKDGWRFPTQEEYEEKY
ncbi:MAG: hypothetical protein IJN54_15370 [Lachnospiraceae bacterium]|nr:hypothetical protein [Lachnospiraceae bacterium]